MADTEDVARELFVFLFGFIPQRGELKFGLEIFLKCPSEMLIETVLAKLEHIAIYKRIGIEEARKFVRLEELV